MLRFFLLVSFIVFLYNTYVPYRFVLPTQFSPRFYDESGRVIDILPVGEDKRVQIEIDSVGELKPEFVKFLLAAENKEYYKGILYFKNDNIDIKNLRVGSFRGVPIAGFARLFLMGGSSGGGSGILQQLSKNLVHEAWDRTISQKYAETILSMALRTQFSLDELLVMYMNQIPVLLPSDHKAYRDKTYGFKSAIIRYYGTSFFSELSMNQFATLASTLKGGRFANIDSVEVIKARRNNIYNRMLEEGDLSPRQFQKLIQGPVLFDLKFQRNECFRSAIDYIYEEASKIASQNGLDSNLYGYRITTTINQGIHREVSEIVDKYFKELARFRNQIGDTLETALCFIDPNNGYILSVVGDTEPFIDRGKLNHAIEDANPIGSTVKPFVYGSFFESGYSSESLLFDGLNNKKGAYNPDNYDQSCTNKKIPAWYCLSKSINKPTADIVNTYVSTDKVNQFLKKCGYDGKTSKYPSIVLGVYDMNVLDLTRMYAPFANGGNKVPKVSILKIRNSEGKEVYAHYGKHNKRKDLFKKGVIKSSTVSAITGALEKVLAPGGTGNRVRQYYKGLAAGKTGTSNNHQDAWFVGYTPKVCGAIWIGGIHNKPLPAQYNSGGTLAAPLWGKIMSAIEGKRQDIRTNKWSWQ